jgi:transposase-like protein
MYYQGVSTRRVQCVLEKMSGLDISSMTVSRVAAELDEKLDEFRDRRLDKHLYPYLVVDARYEKVRVNRHIVSQAVLVVAGYNEEGRREILDWRVEDSESEETWSQVFMDLKDRGLRGVELITSDAHQGIRKAIARHFQKVAWHRCHVHFKREVGRKVTPKYFLEVRRDISAVLSPMDPKECRRRGEEMAVKWEKKFPKLARMIREGLEDCLSVLAFPQGHQRRLKSTNVLERLMREIKRRTRVVSIFPNVASCERLIGANLIEVHEKWASAERPLFNWENVEAKNRARSRKKKRSA